MVQKLTRGNLDKMNLSQHQNYSATLSSNCLTTQPLGLVESPSSKDNIKVLDTMETNHLRPSQTNSKTDKNSVPTLDHMSLNSTDSLPVTELANEPSLKSCQPLLRYSAKISTSLLKRGRDLSSDIWQRLTRQKRSHKAQEEGNQQQQSRLRLLENGCQSYSPMEVVDPKLEGQMEEGRPWILNPMTKDRESGGNSSQPTCLGIIERENSQCQKTLAVPNQPVSFENSIGTSSHPNCTSDSHLVHLEESQCANGNTSLREKPLISTRFSHHSTVLRLIQRERHAWETQKLVLEELKQSGRLSQVLNGLPLGDPLRERLLLYLNTGSMSWPSMETISRDCSQRNVLDHTIKLSSSIKESGTKSEEVKPFCSLTINTSRRSMSPPCRMMESNISGPNVSLEETIRARPKVMFATDSIVKEDVVLPTLPANTDILAKDVVKPVMGSQRVEKETEGEMFRMRPRYLRHNLWTPDADPLVTAAEWTLSADPLPRPSQSEVENLPARQTIVEHPFLFKIVSPINIRELEALSSSHPNRAFVRSVLEGLREGFWPWATTVREGYPLTWDESK